ncbi:hypothetical protein ACFFJX_12545 [Pseudarcicella hirudinis]|uniref:hypothetical protein n=1 Tax=Pseudarcicella hirudinis TaxID=1079859 RepID=UPI0035ED1875
MRKITDRDDDGSPKGKPNTSFFIDNDEREFLTEEALIDAYNEKFKFEGENPEYEIKYIKVIQKRKTQD